jgi:hypothetical protein
MDNILKKFYSGGGYEDKNSEQKVYQSFFTNTMATNLQQQKHKPFIQRDENLIPIVDNLFNSVEPRNYPSYDKLIYKDPKREPEKPIYKSESLKIQMMEEKLRQLEKKHQEEIEQSMPKSEQKSTKRFDSEASEDEHVNKADMMSKMLLSFKDDLINKLNEEGNRNREVIYNLNKELSTFKTDMNNVINTMTNKQKIQSESIKWILEHAGSKRLKGLSQRILTDDVTDMNKYNQVNFDLNTNEVITKPKRFRYEDEVYDIAGINNTKSVNYEEE